MNKLKVLIFSTILFLFGFISHESIYGLEPGLYFSQTKTHVPLDENRPALLIDFNLELELYRNSSYILKNYTVNGSASFSKGNYVFKKPVLSLMEKEHTEFESELRDLEYWEKVINSPGVLVRDKMTVVPISEDNGSFVLFAERAAYLYKDIA